MKKIITLLTMTSLFMLPLAVALPAIAATAPNWNVTGAYVIDMNYQGGSNPHDMSLTQDGAGNLTGSGGSPAGANTYTWSVTSGSVSGDTIDFLANYTATADAVTPQTVLHVVGTIATDGTISGTWSDNYQGGARSGTFSTISGVAVSLLPSLSAEDFGVMNASGVKGYTAGFGLNNATFSGAQSVVMQLYSGTTLLQTNTSTALVGSTITGSQISSPFDVFGTFNYVTDGYWTNVRGSEYGQTLIPTSVVATVTLADGTIVTATNTNLTGDPTTVFPILNGTINGNVTGGSTVGVLTVTGITAVQTTAIADGTFTNGWKYTFDITVPTNETHLSMKFADWTSLVGSTTLAVANNMRISSAQADNSGATVLVTGANVYTTPTLNMTGDLDPSLDGKQVQVTVEVAVPSTTINGSYTTSYGVNTQ